MTPETIEELDEMRAVTISEGLFERCSPTAKAFYLGLAIAVRLADEAAGLGVVPKEPKHAMERAYFTAPIPKFNSKADHAERKKQNRKKMISRWRAMLAASPFTANPLSQDEPMTDQSETPEQKAEWCLFCGGHRKDVGMLVEGPMSAICKSCAELALVVLEQPECDTKTKPLSELRAAASPFAPKEEI